jgi:hypothetical protein
LAGWRTWAALALAGVAGAFLASYALTGSGSSSVIRSRHSPIPASSATTGSSSGSGPVVLNNNSSTSTKRPGIASTQPPVSSTKPVAVVAAPPLNCETLELELPAICKDADCRRKKETCKISEF